MKQVSIPLGASTLSIECGRVAKQADGSAFVRYGDTVVLATACSTNPREGIDFFPLTVDYREYNYAAGKIPGGFFKREGRPTEKEILTSRLIDRPVRPLFADGFRDETQVIAMVLSADTENNPDVVGLVAGTAALYLSDIPFLAPVGAVRVGLVGGKLTTNPTYSQIKESVLNLVVAGTEDAIVMVEAGAKEVSEATIIEAIEHAHGEIRRITAAQKELFQLLGLKKREFTAPVRDEALYQEVRGKIEEALHEAMDTSKYIKLESHRKIAELRKALVASYPEEDMAKRKQVGKFVDEVEERLFRDDVLQKRQRPDRRAFDKVRAISGEVGLLPRTHGSALFTRGETQALVVATLGTGQDEQIIDALEGEFRQHFMLHYNFPPFSVGETGRMSGPGRREIGHGKLAWRAVHPAMPAKETFPYTVRLVSEITESNGSSSMATVCGSSLALMDAGVPLVRPVAGIAMGLIKEEKGYAVLSDILGDEDHLGDMDFKVAGTDQGVTALQMDIKITSITREIMEIALAQAKDGRLHILGEMAKAMKAPRGEVSNNAPRITQFMIPKEKIREVIGTGGKVIREITEATGAKIDIEDDGSIKVASVDAAAAQRAIDWIKGIVAEPEIGVIYNGKVVKAVDFGAFVNFLGAKDGLVHISELAAKRVGKTTDIVNVGDQVKVKVIGFDDRGKVKLSMKQVDQVTGADLAKDATKVEAAGS